MKFISRIEAYSYALYLLSVLRRQTRDTSYIDQCVEVIRIAIENHELKHRVVTRALRELKKQVEIDDHKKLLKELRAAFRASDFNAETLQDKFINLLRRRYESEIAVIMLLQPSHATMHAVGRISAMLIEAIDFNFTQNMTARQHAVLDKFLACMVEEGNTVCLGAFKAVPTLNEIKAILKANSPDTLAQIMHIQYRFARYAFRELPLNIPLRAPCGAYADLIKEYYGSLLNFAAAAKVSDTAIDITKQRHAPGYADRGWIADAIFYASPLYQNEPERGRVAGKEHKFTNQLGLMLLSQKDDAIGFPYMDTKWIAECDDCLPDMNSRTVLDYLENDAIYVTGPSGMTSLLLGQMEVLGNFETVTLKKHYLSAVIAYIAAAGFHSLHEIIGPAEYALRLVPGYKIAAPDIVTNQKAPAPSYHEYFCVMAEVDAAFPALREQAWIRYMNYFQHIYLYKTSVRDRLNADISLSEKWVPNAKESMCDNRCRTW